MIDLHGEISIPFLKKSRFTGSYKGMRYQLEKKDKIIKEATEGAEAQTQPIILTTIWPEPYNFESTADDKKHSKEFPFEADGIWEAVAWLNEEHKAGHF